MSSTNERRIRLEIKEDSQKYHAKLKAMHRSKLLKMYEDITGVIPHPRTQKDWLVIALARFYQTRLYCDRLGYLPGKIAEKNMTFFMSNRLYMVSKERERAERRKQVEEVVVNKMPSIKKMPQEIDIQDRHVRALKEENPYTKEPLKSFYDLLLKKKVLPFNAIQKWCDQQEERVLPLYIFNILIRDKNADWLVRDEDGTYFMWDKVEPERNDDTEVNSIEELKENFSVDKHFESRISDEKSEEIVGDHAPTKEDKALVGKTVRRDRDLKKIEPDFSIEDDMDDDDEFDDSVFLDDGD